MTLSTAFISMHSIRSLSTRFPTQLRISRKLSKKCTYLSTSTTRRPNGNSENADWQATDVKRWRKNLTAVDAAVHEALFKKEGGGGEQLDRVRELNAKVRSIVHEYRVLVSRLASSHHHDRGDDDDDATATTSAPRRSRRRITGAALAESSDPSSQSSVLSLLDSTQRSFLESGSLRYHALRRVQRRDTFEPAHTPLDPLGFTTIGEQVRLWRERMLKNTRYGRSTKSAKVKKDLPKKARMTSEIKDELRRTTREHNRALMRRLWPELKPGGVRRMRAVHCEWVHAYEKNTWRKREVPPLRDRVLGEMVEAAVHPIVEFQADPSSFGPGRPGRDASAASRHVAKCLDERIRDYRPVRIAVVHLQDAFDTIDHDALVETYPLSGRYRRLLGKFLKAPRRGDETVSLHQQTFNNSKRVRQQEHEPAPATSWTPDRGVLFDSGLGKALVNNALDGLEEVVSSEEEEDEEGTDIRIVRYGTSILIFGTEDHEAMERAYQRICKFLKERGLDPPHSGERAPVFTLKPGTSVEYLGFKFLFTGGPELETGRFSKGRRNKRGEFVRPPRFQAIVAPSSIVKCNASMKQMFSRTSAPADVEVLIGRYNREAERMVGYFGISPAARSQIRDVMHNGVLRMKRLLRAKFQSSPGLGGLIRSRFRSPVGDDSGGGEGEGDTRIRHEGVATAKMRDFDPEVVSFATTAPTRSFLERNVYLDLNAREREMMGETMGPGTPPWIEDAFAPKFTKPSEKTEKEIVGDIGNAMADLDDCDGRTNSNAP